MNKQKKTKTKSSRRFISYPLICLFVLTTTVVSGYFAISKIVSATGLQTESSAADQTAITQTDDQSAHQTETVSPPANVPPTDPYADIKAHLRANDTTGLKVVFLTFDDGPSTHTPEVLDILAAYNIKATFFTNEHDGADLASCYQRIVTDGHTLANHTSSHDYSLYGSPSALMTDIQSLRDYQIQLTGVEPPKIFRFPGGSLTANEACVQAVLNAGYNYVDWNVSSGDGCSTVPETSTIESNVINGCHQYDVSVVLCHGEIKDNTRAALPAIIETLLSEGYTFLPMDTDYTYPRQLEI